MESVDPRSSREASVRRGLVPLPGVPISEELAIVGVEVAGNVDVGGAILGLLSVEACDESEARETKLVVPDATVVDVVDVVVDVAVDS